MREGYLLDVLTDETLPEALVTLGDLLAQRGLTFDIVVIGGGALLLLGYIERPTKDLDVVARVEDARWLGARPFPEPLVEAIRDVASALDLGEDWLNPGPADLMTFGLPAGFEGRAEIRRYAGLTVRLAAREDQIAFKLYAAADHWPDQSKHLSDLRRLTPTSEELLHAGRWCRTHDPSPGFRDVLLIPVLSSLGVVEPDV